MPGEIFPDASALQIPQALRKLHERGVMDLPTMFGMDPGTFQQLADFVPHEQMDADKAAGYTILPEVQVVMPGETPAEAHARLQSEASR